MADPKKNPLIGAFRVPVSSVSPPEDAPQKDVKNTRTDPNTVPDKPAVERRAPENDKPATAGTTKPAAEKKGPEDGKATPAGATKPEDEKKILKRGKVTPDGAAKPADEKKIPDGDKTAPDGTTKPADKKKDPEGGKAVPDDAAKPADEKKGPEGDKAAPDGAAKPTDEKKIPEDDKVAPNGAAKPADEKKIPEGGKAALDGAAKPDGEEKVPEGGKDPLDSDAKPVDEKKVPEDDKLIAADTAIQKQEEETSKNFKFQIFEDGDVGKVVSMSIDLIDDFDEHPFSVEDDKDMDELTESIRRFGVLENVTVIPNEKKPGRYIMVAGHRRKHGARRAGLTHIPATIRNMDYDSAVIYMVDSNLKREKISPMEKARAYQMKTEAMKRKMGRRTKEEKAQMEASGQKPMTADEELAKQVGESPATIQRYKALNKLVPDLQTMVDKGKLPVNTGADIAQMKPAEQKILVDAIQKEDKVPTGAKAKELKEDSKAGKLTVEKIEQAVAPTKREETPQLKITLTEEDLRPYFPDKRTTIPDVKRGVFEALDLRKRAIERQKAKAEAEKGVKKTDAPTR